MGENVLQEFGKRMKENEMESVRARERSDVRVYTALTET